MNFRSEKKKVISEMNVVPFIDIMLVLLVIFMITAPLMFNGINLKLPKTKKVNRLNLNKNQIILSYTKSQEIYLGKEKYLVDEVLKEIKARWSREDQVIYLRADFSLAYGKVADLMSFLKRGGISNIALVTEVRDK